MSRTALIMVTAATAALALAACQKKEEAPAAGDMAADAAATAPADTSGMPADAASMPPADATGMPSDGSTGTNADGTTGTPPPMTDDHGADDPQGATPPAKN